MAGATLYLSPISLIVQYLTNIGIIAAGGQVTTYVAGTNTLATTYTDSTGTVPNPNPMTLNAAARPASPSGAPVAFWTLPGVVLKLSVTDASGNQLVGPIDNIPALNDQTNATNALQTLLANPASSNVSGVGPVAGADLVANAVKSYDVFADVRSANEPSLAAGQTLNIEVQGALGVGDGLGGTFYWSPTSTAADDGATVLKPNSVSALSAGRWLRLIIPVSQLGGGLLVPQYLVRATDNSIVSNTVLANDPTLQVTLATGGMYLVEAFLNLLGVGGTGQGYKVQMNFAGTTVSSFLMAVWEQSTNSGTPAFVIGALNTQLTSITLSSGNGDVANWRGVINVASLGLLSVQVAQASSSPNATVLKAGSLIRYTRLK